MYQYKNIYNFYFIEYRRGMRGALSEKTIEKRIRTVMEKLNERDRHILMLVAIYNSNSLIAKVEEIDVKTVGRRVDIAVSHLVTPANVEYVTGRKLFAHTGKSLSLFPLSTRTLNALRKKSDITTIDDLKKWLSYGYRQIYRLPGVGKWGILEILSLAYTLK